jgi:hypothetical protein
MARLVRAAAVIVKATLLLVTPSREAVMFVLPATDPVVKPPFGVTVALEVSEELHVADEVMSAVVPLSYVPIAVNCCVPPGGKSEGLVGVIAIEFKPVEIEVLVILLNVPDCTPHPVHRKHRNR